MTIKYVGIQGIYNLFITSSLLCITSRHLASFAASGSLKVQYKGAKAWALESGSLEFKSLPSSLLAMVISVKLL